MIKKGQVLLFCSVSRGISHAILNVMTKQTDNFRTQHTSGWKALKIWYICTYQLQPILYCGERLQLLLKIIRPYTRLFFQITDVCNIHFYTSTKQDWNAGGVMDKMKCGSWPRLQIPTPHSPAQPWRTVGIALTSPVNCHGSAKFEPRTPIMA